MGGSGKAPKPDKRIGKAAMKMAETGDRYLGWMKDQAKVTNRWAAQDRARYQDEFVPMERTFIKEAKAWDNTSNLRRSVSRARADVRGEVAMASEQSDRNLAAMGVNPDSGRYAGIKRALNIDGALAGLGAGNLARDKRITEGMAMRGDAINLGKGMAVNPGTSMALANGALTSGAQTAMDGQRGMAQTLQAQDNQRMQAWQADNQGKSDLFGAIGGLGGMALGFMSSKDSKHKKRSVKGALEALKKTPVEAWDYKPGMGDGGSHIGPYAEDFKKNTGLGDGKTLNPIDLHGVTMAAVQELSGEVDKIKRSVRPMKKAA